LHCNTKDNPIAVHLETIGRSGGRTYIGPTAVVLNFAVAERLRNAGTDKGTMDYASVAKKACYKDRVLPATNAQHHKSEKKKRVRICYLQVKSCMPILTKRSDGREA
jgi:hypothetical protein